MAPELGGLAGKAVKMKQDPVTASPEHTGTGLLGMAHNGQTTSLSMELQAVADVSLA